MDIVRRDEQYEEVRSELHQKGAQILELESELAQKERDMAMQGAEIHFWQRQLEIQEDQLVEHEKV